MKRIAIFLTLILVGNLASAQFYVGVHGGATLPKSFYGDSRMSDNEWMFTQGHQHKAGAGRGWAAGLDITYAMPFHPSLEVLLSADYMQSPVSRDVEDYYLISYRHRYEHCAQYDMQLPQFRNIPVLAGVRYAYPVTNGVDLYGEALAGVNVRIITDWNFSFADASWTQTDGQTFGEYNNIDLKTYTNASTFAFRVGAGFLLKKKFSIGASFCMLGSSPLCWDRTVVTRYSVYGDMVENTATEHVNYHPVNPIMVTITAGFRLNPFGGSRHVQDW